MGYFLFPKIQIQTLKFKQKFGGRNFTDLITPIQKLFKTMKSSFRYDRYKFALQKLNTTELEGKCEFEWPHTPSFEVSP